VTCSPAIDNQIRAQSAKKKLTSAQAAELLDVNGLLELTIGCQ